MKPQQLALSHGSTAVPDSNTAGSLRSAITPKLINHGFSYVYRLLTVVTSVYVANLCCAPVEFTAGASAIHACPPSLSRQDCRILSFRMGIVAPERVKHTFG